jgi:hypothetical protein
MSDNAAPAQPWHMRCNGFDPIAELARARHDEGVVRIDTAFGERVLKPAHGQAPCHCGHPSGSASSSGSRRS